MESLIPATEAHAVYLGENLRDACAHTILRQEKDPKQVFIHAVQNSPEPLTWMRDGVVMGMGGIGLAEGLKSGEEGFAWIGLTKEAVRHPLSLFRLLGPGLKRQKSLWQRLVTTISIGDHMGQRFAEWLDFNPIGQPDKFGMVPYGWQRLAPIVASASDVITKESRTLLRDQIFAFQKAMMESIAAGEIEEQAHMLPLKHSFIPGAYAREMTIPAGMVLIGKIHRYPCFNFVSQGRITVLSEYGTKEIVAPASFSSPAGIKRIGYAHETTVWTTVHPTDKTDADGIEDELTVPDYECFDPERDIFLIEGERQ